MKKGVSIIFVVFLCFAFSYCKAEGLTKEGIAGLVKDGYSDTYITWQLESSGALFRLGPQDIGWLKNQGVSEKVISVMQMAPDERKKVSAMSGQEKLAKQDIINLSKRGVAPHEIVMIIASTQSKFPLTDKEKEWLASEGVHPLVINIMSLYPEEKKVAPFLERGKIERGGLPVRGGKYYEEAVTIKPGSYCLDHQLRQNEYDYFKIRLASGQRLVCTVRTTEVVRAGAISIHSDNRTQLESAVADYPSSQKTCVYEMYDSGDKDFYILIGWNYRGIEPGAIYDISIEEHFDAGTKADAPRDFKNAVAIRPGEYPDNWVYHNDEDLFFLNLRKGQQLTVRAIPEEGRLRVRLYNEDREEFMAEWSKQAGSVAKASFTNTSEGQKIFIKVDREGAFVANSKYALKIDVN